MDAIALLVIVAGAIGPTIYALLILYQHEQKALILTCIIIDVVYMFSWILMWLGMTLKRDWDFNVTHKVHQFYGLNVSLNNKLIVSSRIIFRKEWQLDQFVEMKIHLN